MGGSSSVEMVQREHVLRLTGAQVVPWEDPLWAALWREGFAGQPPHHREPDALSAAVNPYCMRLTRNNGSTQNLQRLLLKLCTLLRQLADGDTGVQGPRPLLPQALSATHWAKAFLHHLIQNVPKDDVEAHLAGWDDGVLPKALGLPEGMKSIPLALMQCLCDCLVDYPLHPEDSANARDVMQLHLELTHLLIICISTQLYCDFLRGPDIFLDVLMQHDKALRASAVVGELLKRWVEQQAFEPLTLAEARMGHPQPIELPVDPSDSSSALLGSEGSGLLMNIAYTATALVMLPLKPLSFLFSSSSEPCTPLANASLLALLLLVSPSLNPWHGALCGMQDVLPPPPSTMPPPIPSFRISFSKLYTALCGRLSEDAPNLLLYFVLQGSPSFSAFVLSRTDLDSLLLPLLKSLYLATSVAGSHNPQRIYMKLIPLLILSQDRSFNTSVQRLPVGNSVGWYKEQFLSAASLGDIIVLVLVRVVQLNIFKLRDSYLHTSCLATLSNMSTFFERLHPYAASRLATLFEKYSSPPPPIARVHVIIIIIIVIILILLLLSHHASSSLPSRLRYLSVSKRYHKAVLKAAPVPPPGQGRAPAAIYEELLLILSQIVHSCLANALAQNPNLIYSLLERRTLFAQLEAHGGFGSIIREIQKVIRHFEAMLDMADERHTRTVEQVMEIIERGVISWSPTALQPPEPLLFKYTPEEDPQVFFTPYVWTLTYCQAATIPWNPSLIRLIEVGPTAGLFTERDEDLVVIGPPLPEQDVYGKAEHRPMPPPSPPPDSSEPSAGRRPSRNFSQAGSAPGTASSPEVVITLGGGASYDDADLCCGLWPWAGQR